MLNRQVSYHLAHPEGSSFSPVRPVTVSVDELVVVVGWGDGKSQHSLSGNSLPLARPSRLSNHKKIPTPHIFLEY